MFNKTAFFNDIMQFMFYEMICFW